MSAGSTTGTPAISSAWGSSAGSSASFVPKKKQAAATGGEYPVLGTDQSAATQKKEVKKEPEDPCYGKPKEFFIYEFDPASNICICLPEQLTFIAIHYPEHYKSPVDILMWLYDMAVYKESVEEQKRIDEMYKKQPKDKKPVVAGKTQTKKQAKKEVSSESEEEDTTFGLSYKNLQKKKPAAAPQKPVFGGKQLTEAQKEEQRKKKLE